MRPDRFVFDDDEQALCDEVCEWLAPLAQEAGVSRVAEVLRTNDNSLSRNALSLVVNTGKWKSRRNAVRQLWLKERDGLLKCSDMKQLEAWAAERDARWTPDTRTEGNGIGVQRFGDGPSDSAQVAAAVSPSAGSMLGDGPPSEIDLPVAQDGDADFVVGEVAPTSSSKVTAPASAAAAGGDVLVRDTAEMDDPLGDEPAAAEVTGGQLSPEQLAEGEGVLEAGVSAPTGVVRGDRDVAERFGKRRPEDAAPERAFENPEANAEGETLEPRLAREDEVEDQRMRRRRDLRRRRVGTEPSGPVTVRPEDEPPRVGRGFPVVWRNGRRYDCADESDRAELMALVSTARTVAEVSEAAGAPVLDTVPGLSLSDAKTCGVHRLDGWHPTDRNTEISVLHSDALMLLWSGEPARYGDYGAMLVGFADPNEYTDGFHLCAEEQRYGMPMRQRMRQHYLSRFERRTRLLGMRYAGWIPNRRYIDHMSFFGSKPFEYKDRWYPSLAHLIDYLYRVRDLRASYRGTEAEGTRFWLALEREELLTEMALLWEPYYCSLEEHGVETMIGKTQAHAERASYRRRVAAIDSLMRVKFAALRRLAARLFERAPSGEAVEVPGYVDVVGVAACLVGPTDWAEYYPPNHEVVRLYKNRQITWVDLQPKVLIYETDTYDDNMN